MDINITVTKAEHNTILAALRFWQCTALGITAGLEAFAEIASDGGVGPIDPREIDDLCEKING